MPRGDAESAEKTTEESGAVPLRRAALRAAGGHTIRRYKQRLAHCVACICGSCDFHAAGKAGCPAKRVASVLLSALPASLQPLRENVFSAVAAKFS